jgi:hypothetical protein
MDREKENYKVSDLILEHNHNLHLPETALDGVSKENFRVMRF